MFGQMQVTRMFQLSKPETVDEAVAKLLEFAEYPKARAHDARSCQVAKEATLELAYQIVGDRRRSKSLKLAGFASDLADWFYLVVKWLSCARHGPLDALHGLVEQLVPPGLRVPSDKARCLWRVSCSKRQRTEQFRNCREPSPAQIAPACSKEPPQSTPRLII